MTYARFSAPLWVSQGDVGRVAIVLDSRSRSTISAAQDGSAGEAAACVTTTEAFESSIM